MSRLSAHESIRNPDRQSVLDSIAQSEPEDSDNTNLIPSENSSVCFSKRRILSIIAFFGFANVYAMRVNLSVGIVAMVNSTAIKPKNHTYLDTCPPPSTNSTKSTKEGEFVWDENIQSLILGSFFYGYVISNLIGGRLAEVIGGKLVFGCGVLVTAVLTLVTPVAAKYSYILLVCVRILMGFGEGVTFPAMNAMMAKWIPPNERSQTSSIVFAGSQFGTVVSLPICGILCQSDFLGGWPSVFYIFGVLGIVWFILWMIIAYETPEKHPSISDKEKNYILTTLNRTPNEKARPIPYMHILKSMPFWAIVVVHFCQNWGFYTLLTELPTYLKNILHFNLSSSGFIAALPYLVMWCFSLLVGFIADYLRSTGKLSTITTRRVCNSIGHYLPMICLLLIYFSKCNTVATIALLTLAVGFNGATYSGYINSHLDIAPNYAGTLMGITNSIATIPGFLAPTVTAAFINEHETIMRWQIVFWISCVIYFVGNTFYIIFLSGDIQSWNYYGQDPPSAASTSRSGSGDDKSTKDLVDTTKSPRKENYGTLSAPQSKIPEVF